jgi:hypothetical protein
VLAVTTTDVPRASYANARTALEAARDLAYLTAEERHYDFRAASARVCELFEYHELQQRAPSLPELAEEDLQLLPEEVARKDAEDWGAVAPGMGTTLRSALDAVQRDRGRLRQHWSGLKQGDLLREIGNHWGGDALYPKVFDALQAVLAINVHPRPRTGARTVEIGEGDTFLLGTRDADYELPKTVASLACLMAVEALRRRTTFSNRAA